MSNEYKTVKLITTVLLILSIFLLPACSTDLKEGDIIVMPELNPGVPSELPGGSNSISTVQNSYKNFSNSNILQNYYIRPQGNSILNIPLEEKWLDFETVDGLLYLLGKTGENSSGAEYGNKITVYDVDGQQLLKSESKEGAMYMSIAQLDNKVYLYDSKSGELHKYSNDLKLEAVKPLYKGLECSKMCFSRDGWLIMLANEERHQLLYVFDSGFKLKFKVNPDELAVSGDKTGEITDIRDFDIYDSQRTILKIIPQKLCLFNFKNGVAEKVSYMPSDKSIICYDSNILYSAAASLPVNNIAASNAPNQLTRLFLNDSFTWSMENKSLEKWFITPVELPTNGLNTAHHKMKCRGGFVYMLDYPIEAGNLKQSEIIIVNK